MSKVPLQGFPWFDQSLTALFETLSPEEVAAQFVARANAGDRTAAMWIERLLSDRRGTAAALADTEAIDLQMFPMLKGSRVVWGYSYPPRQQYHHESLYPWALVRVFQAGLERRIKRCAANDCRKVFFGDVRARWCSPTCGSKFRVRAKRRRDRQ